MLVDRIGRKSILLASDIIMAISLAALGFYFYLKEQHHEIISQLGWVPLACLISYIVAYSGGAGPIPWIFLAELIPPHVKGF